MSARPLAEIEYTTIINHLATAGRTRDRLLVILGCATGFRITELLSITVGQMWDAAKGEVTREISVARRKMKGGRGAHNRSIKSRRVPLSEPVRVAVRDYLQSIGTADASLAIFRTCKSGGRPMNRSQAFRIMVGVAEECGFDTTRISNHTGRKTFVGRVYRATGNDLIATQRIVAHQSPMTTARYLETDASTLDQVVLGLCA